MWEIYFEWLSHIFKVWNAAWLDRRRDYMTSILPWDFFLPKYIFKHKFIPCFFFFFLFPYAIAVLFYFIPTSKLLWIYYYNTSNTSEATTFFFLMTISSILRKKNQRGLWLQRQVQHTLTENTSQKCVQCKPGCMMKDSFMTKSENNWTST